MSTICAHTIKISVAKHTFDYNASEVVLRDSGSIARKTRSAKVAGVNFLDVSPKIVYLVVVSSTMEIIGHLQMK